MSAMVLLKKSAETTTSFYAISARRCHSKYLNFFGQLREQDRRPVRLGEYNLSDGIV
jgi:hypothetical protein